MVQEACCELKGWPMPVKIKHLVCVQYTMDAQKALHVETSFGVACKLCDMRRLDLCNIRAFDLSVGLKWSKQATQMLRT